MSKFNVVYTIDRAYQVPFCCSISSLLNSNLASVNQIYIIHNLESSLSKDFLTTKAYVAKKYLMELKSIVIDDSKFKDFTADRHVSHATYYRLCIADFLPKCVNEILFIDPDTIVTDELSLFKKLEFDTIQKIYLYAVNHGYSGNAMKRLGAHCPDIKSYFNAGVMYLNLALWRDSESSNLLLNCAKKYQNELLFWDQDVLNIFFHNKWSELPYEYNAYGIKTKLAQTPKIIHYTGNRKPWNFFCDHPYRQSFWEAMKGTPFKNQFLLQRVFGEVITKVLLPIANIRIRHIQSKKAS